MCVIEQETKSTGIAFAEIVSGLLGVDFSFLCAFFIL